MILTCNNDNISLAKNDDANWQIVENKPNKLLLLGFAHDYVQVEKEKEFVCVTYNTGLRFIAKIIPSKDVCDTEISKQISLFINRHANQRRKQLLKQA